MLLHDIMEYLNVEGYSNLKRDPNTNSIINTNMNEYQEYISRRSTKNQEDQKIYSLEQDFLALKNDIEEIKSLLKGLKNET